MRGAVQRCGRYLQHGHATYRSSFSRSVWLQSTKKFSAAMAERQVNVLILSAKDAPELKELEGLPAKANIVATGVADELLGEDSEKLKDVEVLLKTNTLGNFKSSDELQKLWPKLPNLKWVHILSAGITHVLWDEFAESDVTLTNAKRLTDFQARQAESKWEPLIINELKGAQLGIIGYGDIGQATGRLARAFGMKVVALRRRTELSKEEQSQGLEVYPPERLRDLIASSDYLVNALPATPATKNFVNADAIGALQPHAVFINLGRGSTVDEPALTAALQEKKLKGAALDVFVEEPLPKNSPLWGLDNVLITPHCADMTATFQQEAVAQFTEILRGYVQGKPLTNVCDKRAGY